MPGYRVLVVGDMAELGAESEACHVQVGEAAKAAGIDLSLIHISIIDKCL